MSTSELAEFLNGEAALEAKIADRIKEMGGDDTKVRERVAAFQQAAKIICPPAASAPASTPVPEAR